MHRGKRVTLFDFRGASAAEITAHLPAIQKWVTSQPPNSVLSLADWTAAEIDKQVLERIKKVAAIDKPHIKRNAIVAGAASKEIVKALEMFSTRSFAVFDAQEEALDWLVRE